MSSIADQLRLLPLFSALTPRELEVLKQFLRSRYVDPGEALFTEGEFGRSCYVLLSGRVAVFKQLRKGRKERLATLEPGALIGHMALIDNKPRSATCRVEAGAKAVVIELGRDEFDRLFRAKSPFAFKILDRIAVDLSARLREATTRLTTAAAQRDANARGEQARLAAAALESFDTSDVDLDDIDLDAITFEIPDMGRRMNQGGR